MVAAVFLFRSFRDTHVRGSDADEAWMERITRSQAVYRNLKVTGVFSFFVLSFWDHVSYCREDFNGDIRHRILMAISAGFGKKDLFFYCLSVLV